MDLIDVSKVSTAVRDAVHLLVSAVDCKTPAVLLSETRGLVGDLSSSVVLYRSAGCDAPSSGFLRS